MIIKFVKMGENDTSFNKYRFMWLMVFFPRSLRFLTDSTD